jgi:hypothetical protein
MKRNNIFNARKMIFRLLVLSIFFTSCDDFLEESSPIGLSQSKLTDLPSMSALVNGSYSNMRAFYAYQPMITSGFVRDYVIRIRQTGRRTTNGQLQVFLKCFLVIHIPKAIKF